MKRIENGSKEHIILLSGTISICGIILYPIFDLILCKFITNSDFTYSFHNYVIQPIVFGIVTGLVLHALKNKK